MAAGDIRKHIATLRDGSSQEAKEEAAGRLERLATNADNKVTRAASRRSSRC